MVDEHGMNLTKALLATIMKYPGSSLEISYDKSDKDRDIARKKMGYFYADREVFDDVVKSCGTSGHRHPLAFALEAADDIAYRTADIEDAVKKGLVTTALLKSELTKAIAAMKQSACPRVSSASKLLNSLDYYYNKAIEQQYEDPEVYAVQNWVVRIQGMLLTAAVDSFIDHYEEIMSGEYRKELLADTNADIIMDVLGKVAYEHAFLSEPILKLEVAADAIFDFLLDSFVGALRYYDTPMWREKATAVDTKLVGLISSSYKQVYRIYSQDADDNEKLYLRLLLATDFVAGMTDSYARRLYRELRGIEL
jgi:dGTPase